MIKAKTGFLLITTKNWGSPRLAIVITFDLVFDSDLTYFWWQHQK